MRQKTVKLPIGISDYRQASENGCYLVDKTEFLYDIVNDGSHVILLTRPRRFGKTINLSMLFYFLDSLSGFDSSHLFADTAIAKKQAFCQQYQNKIPVIFLSFKDLKKTDYPTAYAAIETIIAELYAQHAYLLDSEALNNREKALVLAFMEERAKPSRLHTALKTLCQYIERVQQCQPYLLLDEYDTPITAAYAHGYYAEMIALMRGLLGAAFKDNRFLARGIITGITRIAQESIFSDMNNLEVYSLLREEYRQYFGFTEPEVVALLDEHNLADKAALIKQWYNGYQWGSYTLYNPWSILNCLKQKGLLKPYWLNTSDNILIKTLLAKAKPGLKQQLQQLLQDNSIEQAVDETLVFPELATQETALWSLLFYSGYLNIMSAEQRGRRLMAHMRIPNEEVKLVYEKMVEQWFSERLDLSTYDKLLDSLVKGDDVTLQTILAAYLAESGSYFDFNSHTAEQVFHSLILGLVVGLKDRYSILSNQESGFGRFDVALIPHDRQQSGLLLELKVASEAEALAKTAAAAVAQIKDKKYTTVFVKQRITHARLLGFAFYGKQLHLCSEELLLADSAV